MAPTVLLGLQSGPLAQDLSFRTTRTVVRTPTAGNFLNVNAAKLADVRADNLTRRGTITLAGLLLLQGPAALQTSMAADVEARGDWNEKRAAAASNSVVDGLSAGRGPGAGGVLAVAAALAGPFYLGVKIAKSKSGQRKSPEPASAAVAERPETLAADLTSIPMEPVKPQEVPAEKPAEGQGPRLLPAGVTPTQPAESLSLVHLPPQPVVESDEALQQAFNTVEAIKEGLIRNDALMQSLRTHFEQSGEQVKLLTGKIDWQQKSLGTSVEPDVSDARGQAMGEVLKSGNVDDLQKWLEEDQQRLKLEGTSPGREAAKQLPGAPGGDNYRRPMIRQTPPPRSPGGDDYRRPMIRRTPPPRPQ